MSCFPDTASSRLLCFDRVPVENSPAALSAVQAASSWRALEETVVRAGWAAKSYLSRTPLAVTTWSTTRNTLGPLLLFGWPGGHQSAALLDWTFCGAQYLGKVATWCPQVVFCPQ